MTSLKTHDFLLAEKPGFVLIRCLVTIPLKSLSVCLDMSEGNQLVIPLSPLITRIDLIDLDG